MLEDIHISYQNLFLDIILKLTIMNVSKPKLAFGYGYNPNILKEGIKKYSFSHNLENGYKLYTFKPSLSYKIFPLLSEYMDYRIINGCLLKNGKIKISNDYFITPNDPTEVIYDLNRAIRKIFSDYEPLIP